MNYEGYSNIYMKTILTYIRPFTSPKLDVQKCSKFPIQMYKNVPKLKMMPLLTLIL